MTSGKRWGEKCRKRMCKNCIGCGRARQVFRKHDFMSTDTVAESEWRVVRTFSTFSGSKDRVQNKKKENWPLWMWRFAVSLIANSRF